MKLIMITRSEFPQDLEIYIFMIIEIVILLQNHEYHLFKCANTVNFTKSLIFLQDQSI